MLADPANKCEHDHAHESDEEDWMSDVTDECPDASDLMLSSAKKEETLLEPILHK